MLEELSATVLIKSYDLIWESGWQIGLVGSAARGGYKRTVIPLGTSVVGGVARVRGVVATLLWSFAFFVV